MRQDLHGKTGVVIIGAGMSGLSAAARLHEAGADFHVIEAQDRLGGRIETEYRPDGSIVEHGAQALNGDMTEVLSATRSAGLNVLPLPNIGAALCDGADAGLARGAINKLEELFDQASNKRSKFADLLDNPDASVSDAVDLLTVTPEVREMMESNIEELWGRRMDQLQFDHAVDIAQRYTSNASDWEMQIAEGFGALVTTLAKPFEDRITRSTPVTGVHHADDQFTVETAHGSVTAKKVIVAVPPTVAKQMLPQDHWAQAACTSYQAGELIKFKIGYNYPFWRDSGLSGAATSTNLSGFAIADTTTKGSERSSITAFIGGPNARRLAMLSKDDRQKEILWVAVRLFGEQAATPQCWTERIWIDDPWSGGAYNAHVLPGGMLKPDAVLRQIKQDMTFACAEIATRFPGYVEGAMTEGKSAANRVIAALSGAEADRLAQDASAMRQSTGFLSKLKTLFGK